MLVLIAILLALIPALAIAYPFLRPGASEWQDDEGSTQSALERRWDAALSALRSAELEHAVGSLADADYRLLRRQCLREAAAAMRAMQLEPEQEEAMLARLGVEGRRTTEPSDSNQS